MYVRTKQTIWMIHVETIVEMKAIFPSGRQQTVLCICMYVLVGGNLGERNKNVIPLPWRKN